MNFRNLFLLLLSVLLLSCDDDDYPFADVPSVVLNEFWTQYPDAKNAEFNSFGMDYEVDFDLYGRDHSAIIGSSGNVLKEKKEVTWNELPTKVQQTLQKDYGQTKIEDPEWVRSAEENYYQAEVNNIFIDKKLVLNSAGEIQVNTNYWK